MAWPNIVIEFIGEGKTDLAVLPVLVHKICEHLHTMTVKERPIASLQKGKVERKVDFAKVQAFYNGSDGAVFVVDTEGDDPGRKRAELIAGRDKRLPDFPMAVGVAHTCIEAWLLTDAGAIARAMSLAAHPLVPPDPEALPAPQKDRNHNPKTVLAECAGGKGSISSQEAAAIAKAINDLDRVITVCQIGFKPFAEEVQGRLLPLFKPAPTTEPAEE